MEIVVTPLRGEYRKLSLYTAEIFQPDFTITIPFLDDRISSIQKKLKYIYIYSIYMYTVYDTYQG